ncbi:MAG: MFS transporter [Candidatus Lokiarchaeota archaeon]|nr:MFS transporter [Candidatus Lokiarchaeota archaeon]
MNEQLHRTSRSVELIIFILYALGPLTGNVILVLFGVLSLEFSVIPNAILIAIPSFMFPFALVQLFSGAISDVKGRFPIILLGLSIFGVGMIIASFSFSLTIFVIANVLAGIGFGFVNPVLIALLTDITPVTKISKKLGVLGAAANLGVGLGPLLAGQIIIFGWRYMYLIFLSLTILGMLTIFIIRKKHALTKSNIGIRVFLSHLVQEIRRLPVILLVISAFLFSHTATAAVIWTSQSFTHAIPVIPETISGIVIALFGVMGFTGGILTGFIVKNKGVKHALIIGSISLLIGNIILIFFGNNNFEALPFTSMGLGFMGFAGGILMTLVMFYSQTLSKERRGALAGLTTAFLFIGIAFVPTTLAPFFNSGGISLVYLIIFVVSMILLIIFVLLYLFTKKKA